MTDANDPAAANTETTPAKPPKPARKPPSAEQVGRQMAWLDGALIALLLVLAFFLGSFAARNTDLWMHLATGRLIAQGGYSFGEDPFSYTSTSPWINHAWLFDLLLYGLAAAAGGIETPAAGMVLVGFKGLLVVALAWVLLQIRRPGVSLWAPAFCVLLALLTMSFSLELHPRVVSLLFLGCTLALLFGQRTHPVGERQPRKGGVPQPVAASPFRLWLLVPLCGLWANLDSWFLLGPLTIGVFWLGEGFQQAFDPGRFGDDKPQMGELRRLFTVFLACVGASLLNPHHLYGISFPAEWAWETRTALEHPEVPILKSSSPWQAAYFGPGAPGRTVAGAAYYVLVLVGILSFLLNQQGWRWARAFLWIVFTLFSFRHTSLLGFTAVVLGPITALNLQDFSTRRFGLTPFTDANGRLWSLGGRTFTVLLVALLLAGAWPGWLHALPTDFRQDRRVAWRVEIEPSLRDAAQQIARWREEGSWTDDQHGFLFHPDVAHYCAWFAPGERGFLDHRYPLFGGVAAEFMKVRQALRGPEGKVGTDPRVQEEALNTLIESAFRKRQIKHVVLYYNEADAATRENDPQRSSTAQLVLEWSLLHPDRWTPVYWQGRTLVFRWRDPRQPAAADPRRDGQVDVNQLAFGPKVAAKDRAPAVCPPWPTQRRGIGERYLRPEAPTPPDMHQSVRWRDYYRHMSGLWPRPYVGAQSLAAFASTVAHANGVPGSLLAPATLNHMFSVGPRLSVWEGSGPPAALILALRAARRAVAANPESASAYQELANVCELLWRQQEEPWNGGQFRLPIRRMQVLGALRQVLALRPDQDVIHHRLGELYLRLGHPDLGVDHLRESLKSVKQAGPRPPLTPEQFQKAVEAQEKQLTQMEAELQKQRSDYLVKSQGQTILVRAQVALERNLVKEAMQVLQSEPQKVGPAEIELLAQLFFSTGRLDDASILLQPERKPILGLRYDQHLTLLSAALGNYKEAAAYLDHSLSQVSSFRREAFPTALPLVTFFRCLSERPGGLIALKAIDLEAQRKPELAFALDAPLRFNAGLRQEAEQHFLRGLVALEEGDNPTAERHLQLAVSLSGPVRLFDGLPVAMRYLKLLQAAQQ